MERSRKTRLKVSISNKELNTNSLLNLAVNWVAQRNAKWCLAHDKDTRNGREIFHELSTFLLEPFPSANLPSNITSLLSELSIVIDLIRWLSSRKGGLKKKKET